MAAKAGLSCLALTVLLGLSAGHARAVDILAACGADVITYCRAITPGDGRVIACLYAHEDQVSPRCDAAIGDMADLMGRLFVQLRAVYQECGDDIRAVCGTTGLGEGQLLSCLDEERNSLSASCIAVLDTVPLPQSRD
ncbi:MAG: cysteine rich repeat-containing protein [Pikeienuella sp.]